MIVKPEIIIIVSLEFPKNRKLSHLAGIKENFKTKSALCKGLAALILVIPA
jgi:hypothetical protein